MRVTLDEIAFVATEVAKDKGPEVMWWATVADDEDGVFLFGQRKDGQRPVARGYLDGKLMRITEYTGTKGPICAAIGNEVALILNQLRA